MSETTTILPPQPPRDHATRRAAERFAPGDIIAGRYRTVALLGRGGMGEVYRAEDLRLNQHVALKFLPARLEHNAEALDLFLGEVRLGRQVSHPNVCRLYDIGEHEGHQFIAMEYVDGEDLASLLKRIGKLPQEKVTELARDIAAGLAAAHATGIVHRDLKPSNVMIDGKGRGRITDFGLAVLDDEESSDGRIIGTPSYMAPEQLCGGMATPRSDVYAFGLIVYECLSGQPLHGGGTAEEIVRRRIAEAGSSGSLPALPGTDPAIDRLMRRCLDPDPDQRPRSGQVVLASLPGGDPLAAAMAAGETPSPELVAAAGESGELTHGVAWSLFATTALAAIAFAALFRLTFLQGSIDGIRSPDALDDRAAEIAAAVSGAPARDRSSWFHWDQDHLHWLRARITGVADWQTIANQRPAPLRFTYRQSPAAMAGSSGPVTWDEPPLNVPGMARVTMDHRGRLMELVAVPPARSAAGHAPIDWQRLFAFADLPMGAFRPAAPEWSPPAGSDERYAWTGAAPGVDMPLRVEAAARAGRPVWFAVIIPSRMAAPAGGADTGKVTLAVFHVLIPLFTCVLAFRNVRRGRGDRRGAATLALVVFVVALVARLIHAHHPPDAFEEIAMVQRLIGQALFIAALTAVAYLGLEPHIRRHEPQALTSWVRLVNGRVRDPLVGRHFLIGFTVGTAQLILWSLFLLGQPLVGLRSAMPIAESVSTLNGVGETWFWMLRRFEIGVMDGIIVAFLLVAIRTVVRRPWLAYTLLYAVFVAILMRVPGDLPSVQLAYALLFAAMAMAVLRTAGVLGVTALALAANVITIIPLTLDPDAFYLGRSVFALFVIIGITALAMISSLGRKPVLGEG